MTPYRPLPTMLRVLYFLIVSVICLVPNQSTADEIYLSEFPIPDLLTHLNAIQNQTGPKNAPAQVSFVVVNDIEKDVAWYFQTEVLEPIAFELTLQGQDSIGQTNPVLQSPFAARAQKSHASQGPTLRSELVTIAPGARLAFDVRFETRPGPEHFPIRLDFKDRLDRLQFNRNLAHGMFFGAMATFVLLFVLSPNFLMNAASRWFAVYLIFIAILAMHSHGYGLILFGLSAETYFPTIRLLHSGVVLSYVVFALSFLNASQAYPRLWQFARVYVALGIAIAILEQVLASPQFQPVANLVPIAFLLLGSVGAYLAVRDRLHGGRFFAAGFAALLVGGVINYLASLPRFSAWNDAIDQVTMVLQAGDAVIFGGALLSQMYGIRRAHDKAVAAQVSEMQRRLDLNAKLRSTEGDLTRARNLAERHRANLAEASHDLRQPITSLRLSLETAQASSPEMVSDLSTGIDFLDHLLEHTLAKTRPNEAEPEGAMIHDTVDAVSLQVIFLNAQRMFAQEAAQKGLSLRFMPTSLAVQAPTIDMIRIVSNLVSNAVRYTQEGGILMGVRRRDGRAVIEIWDTGPGIAEDELEKITQPYFRASPSSGTAGEGIGLSIVRQLLGKNGLKLSVRSRVGKGSVFAVEGLFIAPGAKEVLTNK